jgi:hypothetical protein
MKSLSQLLAGSIFLLSALSATAGTVFYQAIPATQSDVNSGISSDNGYTSAVDAGNTRGTERVINGITLYSMAVQGQSATADNCTLNALSGNLSNGGGKTATIRADGKFGEAVSDMTFNNGASDNSQQEIVLEPDSLEAGATYDLRIYVCNSSGQDRQVNLSFVGDGQAAVETGWFNEDDARTSAGGFQDGNQAYYINYRFTWDGDSTPGITITQKSGRAPFVLYALTNQVVPGSGGAGVATAEAGAGGAGGDEGDEGEQGEGGDGGDGGDGGMSVGLVNNESDEIGVESDDFYNAESLNSNGRWVDVDKWGSCWQPTNVPSGWCPYTNGNWKECGDCGWTFDSEEPWAWACYHYGRWCKIRTGCGWAWVPGKVWGASWVSWRRGSEGSGCDSCLGWAPLPPEAGCELGVGISSWVDESCGIGPDCYTFVNIRDFGCCESYAGCGTCIIDRGSYINIFEGTINCTNICYNSHVNIYCGGPDFDWCNKKIREHGGKECERIHVNRYDDPGKIKGGKHWNKEGNELALHSPKIKGNKNARHPNSAEHVGKDKIDKGWGSAKAKGKEKELRNHVAQETKGKNPKNTKGTLPPGVAEKQKQHAGAGQMGGQHPGGKGKGKGQGQMGAGAGQAAGGGFNQHPGGKGKGKGQGQMGTGAGQAAGGGLNQHPGKGKGKSKGQGQTGAAGAGQAAGGGFDQHPGKGRGKSKGQGQMGGAAAGAGGQQGGMSQGAGGGGKGRHPGQSLGGKGSHGGVGQAGTQAGAGGQVGGSQGGGGGKGKHGKSQGAGGMQGAGTQAGAGGQVSGSQAGGGGGGKGGRGHHKQQSQTTSNSNASSPGQGAGGQGVSQGGGGGGQGGGGGKHHKQQQQYQQSQTQGQNYGQQTGGAGAGGGGKHHKQQFQQQQQQQTQNQAYGQTAGAGGGGGGGGGRGRHQQMQNQQQQYQQQQRQPQQHQQQQGGGQQQGGKKKNKQYPY